LAPTVLRTLFLDLAPSLNALLHRHCLLHRQDPRPRLVAQPHRFLIVLFAEHRLKTARRSGYCTRSRPGAELVSPCNLTTGDTSLTTTTGRCTSIADPVRCHPPSSPAASPPPGLRVLRHLKNLTSPRGLPPSIRQLAKPDTPPTRRTEDPDTIASGLSASFHPILSSCKSSCTTWSGLFQKRCCRPPQVSPTCVGPTPQ